LKQTGSKDFDYLAMLVMKDSHIILLRSNEIIGERPESLAMITSAAFVDLPEPGLLRDHYQYDPAKPIFQTFIERWVFRLKQVQVSTTNTLLCFQQFKLINLIFR
jgi:hypothetical protein